MSRSIIFAVVLLTACANPVVKHNALRYEQAAISNTQAGNWNEARKQWAKAVVNSQGSGESTTTRAIRWYEYGRALGVTCFYEKSEQALLKAHELDREAGEPLFLSLTELARLNYDQHKYQAAIEYFDRAFEELDKADGAKEAPHAYADLLDEYGDSLKAISEEEKAKQAHMRAQQMRKEDPKGYSITDRTPYGTECAQSS